MDSEFVVLGIVWYVIFLFAIVLHEFAHAIAAYKLGDRTAFDQGRLSLDPLPFIKREIFGVLIVPVASYILGGWMIGWASTPFDHQWAEKNLKKHALMSIAGPAANLALFLLAAIFIRIGFYFDIFYAPETINFSQVTASSSAGLGVSLATVLSIFFSLNLILMLFNLLPFPAFDGSSVLPLLADGDRAVEIFYIVNNPKYLFISVIVAWNIFEFVYGPIHLFIMNLLYPGVSYH